MTPRTKYTKTEIRQPVAWEKDRVRECDTWCKCEICGKRISAGEKYWYFTKSTYSRFGSGGLARINICLDCIWEFVGCKTGIDSKAWNDSVLKIPSNQRKKRLMICDDK